jgi:hypothetical protein
MEPRLSTAFGVPVKVLTRPSILPKHHFLGKAATRFISANGSPIFIGGFSFGQDETQVAKIAEIEVIERLFATYELNSDKVQQNGFYDAYDWLSHQWVDKVDYRAVLLTASNSNDGNNEIRPTASGLALRSTFSAAVGHAVLELIERHLACAVWYDPSRTLIQLGESAELGESFLVTNYMLSARKAIPFVMSVIYSQAKQIFTCGTSVGLSLESASRKALMEAYMMLDTILQGDSGECVSTDTKTRVISLQGDLAILRQQHLATKLIGNTPISVEKELDIGSIVDIAISHHSGVNIVPIVSIGEWHLVRAICDNALTLPQARRTFMATKVPADPFC